MSGRRSGLAFLRIAALSLSVLGTAACSGPSRQSPVTPPPADGDTEPAADSDALPASATDAAPEGIPRGQGTPGVAPPFSAEQIRDATQPGRRYLFSVESPSQPPMRYRIDFLRQNADETTYRVTIINSSGQEVSRKENTETWKELESHGEFPADHTKMKELTFTVPAGTYQGYLYEVDDPEAGIRSRLYFAADLPGAAVKVEATDLESGKLVRKMELLEHQPGTATPR